MPMYLHTDRELQDALAQLAETEGVSRREVVRRAVLDRLRLLDHKTRVEDASVRLITRWRDVLDRLGNS